MSASRRQRAHSEAVFPKDRFVWASDGTRLAYTVRGGTGPATPVVFVNGWSCTDSYWSILGPAVAASGHPAAFVDMRGHGESGLPRPPGPAARGLRPGDLSPRRLAEDILEVLDDAGFPQAVLVGHSMGVQAIVETCLRAPHRVAGLVPIAGTFENPVRTFADLAFLDGVYPVAELAFRFLPLEALRPAVRRLVTPAVGHRAARLIGLAGPRVRAEQVAAHVAHIGDANFSVLFRMMSEMRRHETAAELPRINCPVLVLAGRKDFFTPPSVQQKMADLIPGAELVWFDDGGHLLPVEEPEGVVAAVLDFLDRPGRPTGAHPAGSGRRPELRGL